MQGFGVAGLLCEQQKGPIMATGDGPAPSFSPHPFPSLLGDPRKGPESSGTCISASSHPSVSLPVSWPLQCFDLESYLQLNCERGTWRCPVCK